MPLNKMQHFFQAFAFFTGGMLHRNNLMLAEHLCNYLQKLCLYHKFIPNTFLLRGNLNLIQGFTQKIFFSFIGNLDRKPQYPLYNLFQVSLSSIAF